MRPAGELAVFWKKKLTEGCANAPFLCSPLCMLITCSKLILYVIILQFSTSLLFSFVRKGCGKIFDFEVVFDKSNKISLPYFIETYQRNKISQSIVSHIKQPPRLPLWGSWHAPAWLKELYNNYFLFLKNYQYVFL